MRAQSHYVNVADNAFSGSVFVFGHGECPPQVTQESNLIAEKALSGPESSSSGCPTLAVKPHCRETLCCSSFFPVILMTYIEGSGDVNFIQNQLAASNGHC